MILDIGSKLMAMKIEERRAIGAIRSSVLDTTRKPQIPSSYFLLNFRSACRFVQIQGLPLLDGDDLSTLVSVVSLNDTLDLYSERPKYRETINYTIQVAGLAKSIGDNMDIFAPLQPRPLNGSGHPEEIDLEIMGRTHQKLIELGYQRNDDGQGALYTKRLIPY